jgi:holo-[acyl-carrier protein] synthase
MIKGIGVDIIEIERIRKLGEESGPRFLERVFTRGELAYAAGKHHQYQHLAARFAAKEAASKALATGWSGAFRWTDVEVVNDPTGRPRILLHGELERLLAGSTVHVTISHSDSHVVAVVVIEEPRP